MAKFSRSWQMSCKQVLVPSVSTATRTAAGVGSWSLKLRQRVLLDAALYLLRTRSLVQHHSLASSAADDDETGLPDDIAAWEEGDEEDDDEQQPAAAAAARKVNKYGRMPAGISEAVAAIMEGDGGFATTGFNMRQEREEGNIDEEVRRQVLLLAVHGVQHNTLHDMNQYTAGYACSDRRRRAIDEGVRLQVAAAGL
jgi:hypothetical protein